jgi:undecaprenyl diphosphate synthase
LHIAIIMDGNGRWAEQRRLPRTAGHRAGASAVTKVVENAARRGVGMLTLFAFSGANWHRPPAEVSGLLRLFRQYLLTQSRRCLEQSIRLTVLGRRDRLEPSLVSLIESSERLTSGCTGLQLRIAVDYSAQHSLLEVCSQPWTEGLPDRRAFQARLAAVDHASMPTPEVDLLIRTGGEKRLSDFMLWECAYAELHFTDCLWPDFDDKAFDGALADYARRDRRFGAIGERRSSAHG